MMSQRQKFSVTSHHWWCVAADEPLHGGGSHEATTSVMPSIVSEDPQSNFHSPFPPPLMTELSSGSLYAVMSSQHLPVPICQVTLDTWGKPTVTWDPGSYGIPHGQQHLLLSQENLSTPCMVRHSI